MKHKILPLALLFTLASVAWAQDTQSQAPPSATGSGSQNQPHRGSRQQMMEMHKKEIEAMKADLQKMKSSLAEMKANLFTIKDTNELARWRNNVDMWETLVGHMDGMLQHMESMGPGPAWAALRQATRNPSSNRPRPSHSHAKTFHSRQTLTRTTVRTQWSLTFWTPRASTRPGDLSTKRGST